MLGPLLITVSFIGLSALLQFTGIFRILNKMLQVSQAVANKQSLSIDFSRDIVFVVGGHLLFGLALVLLATI